MLPVARDGERCASLRCQRKTGAPGRYDYIRSPVASALWLLHHSGYAADDRRRPKADSRYAPVGVFEVRDTPTRQTSASLRPQLDWPSSWLRSAQRGGGLLIFPGAALGRGPEYYGRNPRRNGQR